MAERSFIESLKIKDNIFELKGKCVIGYLAHYSAPFTGGGEHEIPAGVKFRLYGPMRDDALYMDIIEDNNCDLFDLLVRKEKENIPQLSTRLSGFSFYITEEQLAELPLKFISGSRERSLEIIELIRKTDREFVDLFGAAE
jgi:hypothetical protein